MIADPISMPYAGYWLNSSSDDVGSRGFYWSRTANYAYNAYYLYFGSGSAYAGYYFRSYGFSVRCLVK